MKIQWFSSFPAASIAALSAILGLAACQNQDSSLVPSAPSEIPEAPLATAAAVNPPDRIVLPPRKPSSCNVNYNDPVGLGLIPDQAHQGFSENYTHNCIVYFEMFPHTIRVITNPINHSVITLTPEFPTWCYGPSPMIGQRNGSCVNQSEGKYWPRRAGNIGGKTGVHIFAEGNKDFDIESIEITYGSVRIELNRPGLPPQYWSLPEGPKTFPPATRISSMKIFHYTSGSFAFDNLKIKFHP